MTAPPRQGRWPMFIAAVVVGASSGCADAPHLVSAGLVHTCELRDGRVRCWGDGEFGQLGLDGAAADHLDAGGDSTCIVAAGRVRCVGSNHRGQLGDGTTSPRSTPVDVMTGAREVSVGYAHACALDDAGGVYCWGWNGSGQVAPIDGDVRTPRRVELPAVARVTAGYDTSCALTRADDLHCWGAIVLDEPGVNDVAIGADHVCALRDDSLTCWGAEPGGGRPPLDRPLRIALSGGQLASGAIDHVCFTDERGAAHCLGKNTFGQLGRGDLREPPTPSPVFELGAPVRSLSVGGDHSCAVVGEQTWCWGWNEAGQLGQDDGLDSLAPIVAP